MKFKTIHSLGSRCQNSEILKHYNYREFAGFFDFMNTLKYENVRHIIKDDFNELLKDENNFSLVCTQTTTDPETGLLLPTSVRTSNKFYDADHTDVYNAIFPHHDLNSEKDKNHFLKCHQRFKSLINVPTLFNYTFNTWENNPTVDDLAELADILKEVHGFKDFKICFIGVIFNSNSSYNIRFESEYFDVWNLNIQSNSFTGGLFRHEMDNQNYIDIIKQYDIDENRITKEEIDNYGKENTL